MTEFLAHRSEDGSRVQSLLEHLKNVSELAGEMASVFGANDFARAIGLAHDLGKYSEEFQRRIRGATLPVDHSSAGAQYLNTIDGSVLGKIAAYCVAGHHAGLPDGGSKQDVGGVLPTLYSRIKNKRIPDFQKFRSEIADFELTQPSFAPTGDNLGFSLAFFTRMVYSCLVDADWLDTELFMTEGKITRGDFKSLGELKQKLDKHLESYEHPTSELNVKRTELLDSCLLAARREPGLYTLTAPTGSGKTLSSMAFSLTHAIEHGKGRVLYVVPYNTIIEQNAQVFENIFGVDNVVQHHRGINYGSNEDSPDYPKLLATENWDAPVVMTSSVQFFESLFSNRSSQCRKLHNIAGSVIVFDEAQMIPLPRLIPCIQAIRELVEHYSCTVVLATATQSSLDEYFEPLKPVEIVSNPQSLYEFFRRVTFKAISEPITEDELLKILDVHAQVLCIVNTRKRAQSLAEALGDDVFHLSTTMCPVHRSTTLNKIRRRLGAGEPCKVVSTSMIEAGVDVDFPVLYREKAGLDSVIQAAGRCNREGKHTTEQSIAYIFTIKDERTRHVAQNIAAYEHAARNHSDIASLNAISTYFKQLRYIIGNEGLDKSSSVTYFNDGFKSCSFPFKTVAKDFKLIEDDSKTVIVPLNDDALALIARLRWGERSRDLFRKIQEYSVSLYRNDLEKYYAIGAIERIDEEILVLTKGYYDNRCGVTLSPQGGLGLFA